MAGRGGVRQSAAAVLGALVAALGLCAVPIAAIAQQPRTVAVSAAAGPPSCTTPSVFLAERAPTQLYRSLDGAGTTSFQKVGTTHGWNYNAVGYDPGDRYLYGVSIPGKGHPAGHLLRIDAAGGIEDLGAITGDPYLSARGANTGAFDGSGHFWVTSPGNPVVDEVAVARPPRVLRQVRLSPKGAWKAFDFTFDGGSLWGMTPSTTGALMQRLDLSNGRVTDFRAPRGVATGSSYGAAWTYGNGNLGFDDNSTGQLFQIAVSKASSSAPAFSLVSQYSGPIAGNNDDGAACVPAAVDLAISLRASTTIGASQPMTWTIEVTNKGKGISSGYAVHDTLPAQVTRVSSGSAGCRILGNAVTCSEGKLLVGKTATYVISGLAPAKELACFSDTATVIGNEADPDPANNAARAKTCTAPDWRLATPPDPSSARGWLNGTDCPSASLCVAVGGSVAPGGAGSTLVERRSGTSFVVQTSPNPPGDSLAVLSSVSCSSASSCVAVGDYEAAFTTKTLAEVWNGRTWSIDYPANRAGADVSQLNSVSCTSSRSCVAVGEYQSGAVEAPLLERWNGTKWAPMKGVLPTDATLEAVSCTSADWCMAAGQRSSTAALAAVLSGSIWRTETLPLPAGSTFSSFAGLSCTTSSFCEATGFFDTSLTSVTLAEGWNGTAWTVQSSPNPSGSTFAELSSVSCQSSTACSGVGEWSTVAGDELTLAERLGPAGWTLQTTSNPVPDLDELNAVGCSPGSCTAVGLYAIAGQETTVTGEPDDFYSTLAERSSGAAWTTETSADSLGPGTNAIQSLSCASASFCMAATSTSSASGETGSYERWNGSDWSLGSFADNLQFGPIAVSCSSATSCVAIGEAPSSLVPAAQTWSGSSWKPTRSPPGSDVNWYGIDCVSAIFCVAVGSGLDVDDPMPIAETWNGTAWSLDASMPLPAGGTFPSLTGVSCPTTVSCVAVGSYLDSSEDEEALAETWDGSTWTLLDVPEPAGSTSADLAAVACAAAGSCVAVGAAGPTPMSKKIWATELVSPATTWSTLPLTVPSGSNSSLTAVSCTTVASCTLVGSVGGVLGGDGPEGPGRTLAERWNGKTATVQATPNLPGVEADSFSGVACVAATECVGAGLGWYPDEVVGYGAVWK